MRLLGLNERAPISKAYVQHGGLEGRVDRRAAGSPEGSVLQDVLDRAGM